MLKTINRIPRNPATFFYEVEKIGEEELLEVLSCDYSKEGIYGFEWAKEEEGVHRMMVVPSFFQGKERKERVRPYGMLANDMASLYCYHLVLEKPNFLPLKTIRGMSVLEDLMNIPLAKGKWYAQCLFTKWSGWQGRMLQQYEAYLDGNDYPAHGKMGRSLQGKLLNVLHKVSGQDFRRSPVEEIDQKLLDEGYHAEIRLLVYGEASTQLEEEIEEVLRPIKLFNGLSLYKVKEKGAFLRHFMEGTYDLLPQLQLFSQSEIISLLLEESPLMPKVARVDAQKAEVISKANVSPLIDLLPMGSKPKREVNMDIAYELGNVLKKAKVMKNGDIRILDVELGATVQRIKCEIPEDTLFSDIKRKYEDIKAFLGTDISIIQGEANTVTFLVACAERELIYLKEILVREDFQTFASANRLPFIGGMNMNNEPVYKCLTKAPHLLIAGATNSGKSVFVNTLLVTYTLLRTPEEVRLILIDPKQVEFQQYEGFPHVDALITDMSLAMESLSKLVEEMERRYSLFAEAGVKKIDAYNLKSSDKLPYLICAIDEYNDFIMAEPDVEQVITRLGQKARAAGIHLIIATQRPDKTVLTGVIKANLPSRISFQLNSSADYQTVFGTGIPYRNLMGFGDGIVKYVGQTEEFIRFQAPVITLDEELEEEVYETIKDALGRTKTDMGSGRKKEKVEEEPIDKLKRIISDTGELRVGHLQKAMGIRINVVTDLMKQLVEESFLMKEGRSYVRSEEE